MMSASYETLKAGDIKAAKLIVTEGASFTGHCAVGPNAGSAAPATNRIAEKETAQRR